MARSIRDAMLRNKCSRMPAPPLPSRPAFVIISACLGALVLGSIPACVPREGRPDKEVKVLLCTAGAGLEGELASFIEQHPLPEGFSPISVASEMGQKAAASLILSWAPMGRDDKGLATSATRKGAIRFRRRWLAPAVGLADPRWSVTETEARALGLVDLDSISLPERALPVDGRFPGEAGWPFVEELLLSLETPGGARGRALEAWLAEAAEDIAASANDGPPLILGAVGDIVVGPEEASFLFASEAGRTRLLDGAAGELDRAGILLGNLESPVAAAGEANPRKRYHFLMPPGSIASLKAMGFDLLGFANNHVLDYGEGAFLATLDEAKSAGLPLAGAGRNATEALAPFCPALPEQDRGAGASIAVIGFASYPKERMGFTTEEGAAGPDKPGTNSDEAATCEAIRKAREAGKLVLVFAHGGSEYRFEPAPEVKARYRSFIDAGAEAVIASHPHVLQGVEAWQGGLIAYSLGNFLFTGGDEPLFAQDAGILYLFIHGGAIRGLGFTPVFAGFLGTRLSPGGGSVLTAFASRTAALAPGK